MNAELNQIVQDILDGLVASGEEIGLQAAAYVDGELAVDCWAGLADRATGREVDGDTLFMVCSAAKGVTSTCLHLLADRGLVAYDAPVARYWPEFAAHGKEGITIRHVLTHTAGVPQMPDGVTPEMTWDWEAMCAAIADATPLWQPGTTACYHALSFGWLVGEVVRRVDGRSIAQFCREALCEPLGAGDIYLAVPEEIDSRVATVEVEPFPDDGSPWTPLLMQVLPLFMVGAEAFNRPAARRASIPARGTMSARGLARHYAMLAGHGELNGVRLLSPQRVDAIRALQTDARDLALGGRVRRGLGYMLGGPVESGGNLTFGSSGGVFGHPGYGGSAGFADPERRLGFALAKTYLRVGVAPGQGAAYRVAQAMREYLDAER
jgi:CubicO group peptidase (beta-lactamase class C family)